MTFVLKNGQNTFYAGNNDVTFFKKGCNEKIVDLKFFDGENNNLPLPCMLMIVFYIHSGVMVLLMIPWIDFTWVME